MLLALFYVVSLRANTMSAFQPVFQRVQTWADPVGKGIERGSCDVERGISSVSDRGGLCASLYVVRRAGSHLPEGGDGKCSVGPDSCP
jgi:hypothetical protein